MHRTRPALLGLALLAALAPAAPAKADVTLGSAAASGSPGGCGEDRVIAQATDNPSNPYFVRAAGRITQWQVNTLGAAPGASVALVVLRPAGSPNYSVVGTDARSVPSPLPAGGVATFPLASPITVAAGDTLGLFTDDSVVACWFQGGSIPVASTLTALGSAATPAFGQVLSPISVNSPPAYTMNVAANFAPPAKKKKCKKKKGKKGAAAGKKKCKKKKGKKK